MLYIHKLSQLTNKTAEVESVYLIREIKQRTPFPISEQKLQEYFNSFFTSDKEREQVYHAIQSIEPTIQLITNLLLQRDPVHEPINIQRAIKTLKEMPEDLLRNLSYIDETLEQQQRLVPEVTALLNSIPRLRTMNEKMECNQRLKQLFESILRNKEFSFNFSDIINEAHVSHITSLRESMKEGVFFYISLEEELKKSNFAERMRKIPKEKLDEVIPIESNIAQIEKGLQTAYSINMRRVNLALILYSYVKWMQSTMP